MSNPRSSKGKTAGFGPANEGSNPSRGTNGGYEMVKLPSGQEIFAHTPERCASEYCTIHNPSPHHMDTWPQHFRDDTGIMERICPHGIGHPDPDDINIGKGIHGCDGCCNPNRAYMPELYDLMVQEEQEQK